MKDVMRSTIWRKLFLTLTLSLFLAGCTTTLPPAETPAERPVDEYVKEDVVSPIDIYDPLEGLNRGVYKFNYYFDQVVFVPVVDVYEFLIPPFFQHRVTNFVDNVFEFFNLTNSLFQLNFRKAGITVSRFTVNTTFGVLGFFDTASEMGLQRQHEDFGQTLAYYGVGNGPYLVIPVLGPSNFRDGTGLLVDALTWAIGPEIFLDERSAWTFLGVTAVSARHREAFRYYSTGSPFEYDLVRMLYTKKRELDIAR